MQASLKKKLFIGLIVFLVLSRFLFPEADPAWWKSTDDIHDEAWWAENVRRMLLGEPWPGDVFARAWAVGPLTAVWHWISFSLFGIHFFSLRLIALIPSTLSILLILFKKIPGFDDNKRFQAAIILAVLPAFWSLSRIGHIEAMLSFILLLIVFLSYSKKTSSWLIIGILVLVGFLFKFSFIYYVFALLTWFLVRSVFLKNILYASTVCFFGGCVFYAVYFYPNRQEFQPFYTYLSSSFYSVGQLIDPRGWLLRLAWFHEKTFVTNPVNVLLISAFLIRIGRGKLPNRKTSIASFFAISIMFLLCSDFSDRRLIVLLILLPLAFLEEYDRESSPNFRYALAWFCGLPLFISFSNMHLFNDGNQLNELLHIVPVFLIAYTGFFLFAKFIFKKYVPDSSLRFLQLGIVFWIVKALVSSAIAFVEITGFNFYIVLFSLLLIIGIMCLNDWFNFEKYHPFTPIGFVVLTGTLLIAFVTFSTSYTLRDSAVLMKEQCGQGQGIGPESLVELSLLGTCNTELHLDVCKKSIEDSSQYVWFAGITTPMADKDSLQKLYEQSTWMIASKHTHNHQVIPLFPSPNGFREYLVLIK